MVLKPVSKAAHHVRESALVKNPDRSPPAGLKYSGEGIRRKMVKMVWQVECIPPMPEDIEFNSAGIGNGQGKPSLGFNPAMNFLKSHHRIMQMFQHHPPDRQTK